MRKRMIDPSFWDSSCMGRCCIQARLLFIGMVSHADDEGRLVGEYAFLRSRLFPYDELSAQDIEAWVNELEAADRADPALWRYEVNGRWYIQLPKWHEYQKISHPQPSKLPLCPPDQMPEGLDLPDDFYTALASDAVEPKKSKKGK